MAQCYEFNYTSSQPQPLPDVWVKCPVGDNCCIGTDLCLSNNICHHVDSSKEKREASYSSYYNARCTDPTYTNPACDKICIGSPPDIVYNYTSNLWACCGNDTAGEVTCANPLHEYYEAPAPDRLATLSSGATLSGTQTLTPYTPGASSAPTEGSSSTTGATSATTAPASTSQSSSATSETSGQSGGLGTGAKAGIGVGVALAVIALIVAILFWLRQRRRRDTKQQQQKLPQEAASDEKPPAFTEMPVYGHERKPEMDSGMYTPPVELDNDSVPSYASRQH